MILSGCATAHDREIQDERHGYQEECDQWQKEFGDKLFIRKTGEENLPIQEIIATRCKETPANSTPPQIPTKLRNDEYMWGVSDPTPNMCNLSAIQKKRKGY